MHAKVREKAAQAYDGVVHSDERVCFRKVGGSPLPGNSPHAYVLIAPMPYPLRLTNQLFNPMARLIVFHLCLTIGIVNVIVTVVSITSS